ncbi:MAG: maltose alpha-D-glucosyltransferase [Chthoniobacteraceae bacterium]
MSNSLWFKNAVIYQLHVKTFQDSDGDGVGDFGGLIQRLDYLAELGVTALWLMPFYPSPLRDDGYDIADYLMVNPSYGTLEQFDAFLAAAHDRGLKVITELVLNHTSDQHPWFQRARRAPVGSPERDYYVWSETPERYREARVIFQDFEPSNWTWDHTANAYFWHRFFAHQPDLNFDNPLVHDELLRVIDFWMERGVDGVRLDAVPYLYEREGTNCENLPETHAFLRKLRAHIDAKYSDRMMLAEANQWPEDSAAYFGEGDECQMNFHFPLMPRLFMALQMEDRFPIIDILEQTPAIPANCQWAIFLRNHDELTLEMVTDEERDYMVRVYAADPRARINLGIRRRLAPLLGNNRRKIELINSLLLSLPGTPILYYGDELGMGDNIFLGDRNGVRTPMQWSPDRNGGFSSANPQRLLMPLIIDPEYHYETVNAENQQRNVSSLFWWMRRILAVRKGSEALAHGAIEFLQPENAKVLAYLLRSENETVLVVANLSRFAQVVELDLRGHAGAVPEELFGNTAFPALRAEAPMVVTLGPHGFYWFALRGESSIRQDSEIMPTVTAFAEWTAGLGNALTTHVLPGYLPRCAWFQAAGRTVREYRLTRVAPLLPAAWLAWVEVTFQDGTPEMYLLPIARVEASAAAPLSTAHPRAIIARVEDGSVLADAFFVAEVRERWLRLHLQPDAKLASVPRQLFALDPATLERAAASSRVVEEDRANTSIAFADALLLKVYRRVEEGPHPEVELLDALQRQHFTAAPLIHGSLAVGGSVVSSLTSYIAHQGNGWMFILDALSRFFDRALESRLDPSNAEVSEVIGAVLPERMGRLGESIAALHRALAGAFPTEPFTTLHQRSLYQAMRGQAGRVLRLLRRHSPRLDDAERGLAARLMEGRPAMLKVFGVLLDRRFRAAKTRVHGDLHLGQLLNTGKDFVFIDFEGEAGRPIGERALKRCPLVDLAAMLRSLDYAAAAALRREAESDRDTLRPWAALWTGVMTRSLTTAYFAALDDASFIPPAAERDALLHAFLLDRALREVAHELDRRGELLGVPLAAASDLPANLDAENLDPPSPASSRADD